MGRLFFVHGRRTWRWNDCRPKRVSSLEGDVDRQHREKGNQADALGAVGASTKSVEQRRVEANDRTQRQQDAQLQQTTIDARWQKEREPRCVNPGADGGGRENKRQCPWQHSTGTQDTTPREGQMDGQAHEAQ